MYLGIDVGTSAVKAVLVDDAGRVASQGKAPLSVQRPRELWSEQDPADWWTATNQAVSQLDIKLRRSVRGAGIAGQMHGATLLGADGRPLRPAILWNDGRSGRECEELEQRAPRSRDITGNLAMPGFTAPKLLWVQRHEPEIFSRTRKVLLPKDYVRLRMTGDYASDMSDSAGTLWLDVAARRWSEEMLGSLHMQLAQMPELFEGCEAAGVLRSEIAEAWAMPVVPVAAGAGDNAAGAVGVGVISPGDAFLSLGTSGVLFVATDRFRPNPRDAVHAFCHCLPARWHQMSVTLSAAACVEWAARLCGEPDATALLAKVAARAPWPGREVFLPYLSGERTPHNDPFAKGVFFGITPDTDSLSLMQAVLEGVAFAFADGLDALCAADSAPDNITVIGGGARSAYWGRILSAALGRPLVYRDGGDVGPAYGAARLARIAATGESPEAVCTPPPISQVIEPQDALVAALAERRVIFRNLYRQLRDTFREGQP